MTNTQTVLYFTILLFATPGLMAGQTPILNGDLPGGSGDWEGHVHNLVAECEITSGEYKGIYRSDDPDLSLPDGYFCESAAARCSNEYSRPKNSCVNMKVRWLWASGSTPWFDRDLPTGVSDYEAIELQLKLECLFGRQTFVPGDELPAGYTCHHLKGAWCENSKTQPLNNCKHAPVSTRYSW
jgi:hypothetical protein